MSNSSPSSFATALAPDEAGVQTRSLIEQYAAFPLFDNTPEWIIRDNPYRRPVNSALIQQLDFNRPLAIAEILGPSALAAHRMLLNIYETDLIFLPASDFAAKKNDFASYYSNDNKLLGELIRPTLETHVFDFLKDEVNVAGNWSVDALRSYLQSILARHEQSELEICQAVLDSDNTERACRALLIQVAGDFLSEASASSRNILGKYGEIQSEFFKIVIDDYGYGVHPAKHSTLFENTLSTCGLSSDVHAYWHFYLSSSLALNNYYHYVSRDHSRYFQALGAIAVAEAMFSHTCSQISKMLRKVFGKSVDTYYFDEHFHIDAHHGRMALEHVVVPAIARHGDGVIPDIVRGLEELQLLTSISDNDLKAQITFSDAVSSFKALAQRIHQRICEGKLRKQKTSYVEHRGQALVTQVFDCDKLYAVESGALDLVIGHDQSLRLEAGEAMMVTRHRLHGIAVMSEECRYHIYTLGNYESCLS